MTLLALCSANKAYSHRTTHQKLASRRGTLAPLTEVEIQGWIQGANKTMEYGQHDFYLCSGLLAVYTGVPCDRYGYSSSLGEHRSRIPPFVGAVLEARVRRGGFRRRLAGIPGEALLSATDGLMVRNGTFSKSFGGMASLMRGS